MQSRPTCQTPCMSVVLQCLLLFIFSFAYFLRTLFACLLLNGLARVLLVHRLSAFSTPAGNASVQVNAGHKVHAHVRLIELAELGESW